MLIGYGSNNLAFAIAGSGSGAAFLSDTAQLSDGRTGAATAIQWISGAQTLASYVQIIVTISGGLDTVPVQGVVGFCNCSLPEGTKIQIGSVVQRLVAGSRGERSAWAMPFATGSTLTIKIFNDVNGVASIGAGSTFTLGEIFVGRVIDLPSLIFGGERSRTLIDPTADRRSSAGQNWPIFRKPYYRVAAKIGYYSRAESQGLAADGIPSGSAVAGNISMRRLIELLSTNAVSAVCDLPDPARTGTKSNGLTFDASRMQPNWMLARPSSIAPIAEDQPPYASTTLAFDEAI